MGITRIVIDITIDIDIEIDTIELVCLVFCSESLFEVVIHAA